LNKISINFIDYLHVHYYSYCRKERQKPPLISGFPDRLNITEFIGAEEKL